MRAVQYSEFGGPEVLRLVEVAEPHAGSDQIRVVVHASTVNPIDWKLRGGGRGGQLPQGTGREIAGVVDEVGDEVTGVSAGDRVFALCSDGAAEYVVLSEGWALIPASLDFVQAAALPMAAETATRALDELGVEGGQTLLINGGAGVVGSVAAQIALARGARVIVTAGDANTERLRGYGAEVTRYGDGLVERVASIVGDGDVDRVLDMSPPNADAIPTLVQIAGGPEHVLTISDHQGAADAGARSSGGPGGTRRYDALEPVAAAVAEGRMDVPVQQTFPLSEIVEAQRLSEAGHLTGKLVLLVR